MGLLSEFGFAQESNSPNIAYVYPAGGQRGSTFRMLIGGSKFKDVDGVFFGGDAISAKIVEAYDTVYRRAARQLRMKLEKEYILANPGTKEKIEEMGREGQAFLRKKTMEIPENREKMNEADASEYLRVVSSDALAETLEIEVTIAQNAPLGEYSVMIMGPNGISNPAKFLVSDLPEKSKVSLRKTAYDRARTKEYWGRAVSRSRWGRVFVTPENNEPIDVELPVIVNGQITEGNTDFWRFKAKKGQKIVMSVWAQSLLPYISDAVPGWFQTVLKVRDSKGKEIAYNDDFHHRPDSYLVFDVPADGEYCVEIFDAVHRGREDFVYRMLIGEVPFIESIFPLGISAGEKCEVELTGVNLKSDKTKILRSSFGEFEFESDAAYHNRIPLVAGNKSAVLSSAEQARRDSREYGGAAQQIKIPSIVDGRIFKKGQTDIFKFNMVHGNKIVVETFARRLDSPLDSYLVLTDANGKILAHSDDFEDLSYGNVTHHADSRIEFTAPATGEYFLRLSDASDKFSMSHSYRLVLNGGMGDFAVVANPSTVNMRKGGSASIKLKAFRRNGFKSPITVELKNLPKGWKYCGGKIGGDSDEGEIIITSSPDTKKRISTFRATATSSRGGEKISRRVLPCEDMMQAFYYRHYVPFDAFYAVSGNDGDYLKWFESMKIEPPKETVYIPANGKKSVRIASFTMRQSRRVAGAVSGTDKVSAESFYCDKKNFYAVLKANPQTSKIGDKGEFNLAVNMKVGRKLFNVDRVPAIKFEIVDPSKPLPSEAEKPKAAAETKKSTPPPDKKAEAEKTDADRKISASSGNPEDAKKSAVKSKRAEKQKAKKSAVAKSRNSKKSAKKADERDED